jgi:hypothetical protein
VQSKATTVPAYLAELPPDRRKAIEAVRKVIVANLDKDVEEGMQYGMIGYAVPHRVYPDGYHCNPKQPVPFAAIASQKQYMSLYVMSVYGQPKEEKWLRERWAAAGKKLDMGKCCIRFKSLDDLPLDVVGEMFRRVSAKDFIAHYESVIKKPAKKVRPPASTPAARGTAASKPGARATPVRSRGSRPSSRSKPSR